MKRSVIITLILLSCLFSTTSLFAQGSAITMPSQIIAGTGRPIGGATVIACAGINITGLPCSPATTIYQDIATTIPFPSSVTCDPPGATGTSCTDGLGNILGYLPAGEYTITITGRGVRPASYNIAVPCTPLSSCGGGGGGACGTLAANEILFGTGMTTCAVSANFTWNNSTSTLSITGLAGLASVITGPATGQFAWQVYLDLIGATDTGSSNDTLAANETEVDLNGASNITNANAPIVGWVGGAGARGTSSVVNAYDVQADGGVGAGTPVIMNHVGFISTPAYGGGRPREHHCQPVWICCKRYSSGCNHHSPIWHANKRHGCVGCVG